MLSFLLGQPAQVKNTTPSVKHFLFVGGCQVMCSTPYSHAGNQGCAAGLAETDTEKMHLVLSGSSCEFTQERDHSFAAVVGNKTVLCNHTGDNI